MRTLYWMGNSAKTRVIDEILQEAERRPIVVFDYGCGEGGDWPRVLPQFPNISLVGHDPSAEASRRAEKRLRAFRVRLTAGDPARLQVSADFVVSFSVFEHVYDRRAYLAVAHRCLARGGTFYLNYDDGHFRPQLPLDDVRAWPAALRVGLHNGVAPLLARAGVVGRFQARVRRDEADRLLTECGFQQVTSFYSNLDALKALFPAVPPDRQEEFCRFWLEVERELNERFATEGALERGDRVNLWRTMPSRTVVLVHAGADG